jgi:CRISPR/Cas system CSM-associated protein Csm4 (group 5 of RAMP superfamily)
VTEIVTYKIDMRLMGRMTQIPDSQKIFGALIYMYAERYSSEQATDFVSKIKHTQIYLAVSNLLPLGYIPTPQNYLLNQLNEKTLDGKSRKQLYKALKKRSYLRNGQIDEILRDPTNADKIYPYAGTSLSQQIHVSIDSLFHNLPGLDPNLFSVPEITVLEQGKEASDDRSIHTFSFFLSVEKCGETIALLEAIQHSKEKERLFFLGSRSSQGLNTFKVQAIQAEPNVPDYEGGRYLNLGMLLPRKINFALSSLKLFTSERRPYNPSGGWDKGNSGRFISFIEAGSVIHLTDGLRHAGCSIPSPFQDQEIVFGNAFLYPINLVGEG